MQSFVRPRRARLASRTARTCIESLESRTFLNATVTSVIAPFTAQSGAAPTVIDLRGHFNDPNVPGSAAVIQTPLGSIPIQLLDAQTPKNVANFLQYIAKGEYNGVIIHRSVPGFVIQGGGFLPNGTHTTQLAPVQGEPGVSNTIGTIAMALSSGPDSGTNEWFINTANNDGSGSTPNLNDTSDGGPFTVFGRVIYGGMNVVNQIAALPLVNDTQATPPFGQAFSELPVINYGGTSPAASVPAANMVVTNTLAVFPVAFKVTSDNPSAVNPVVSGNNLTLNYGSTGTANITVTGTDLGNNAVSTAFAVTVQGAQVIVGSGGAKLARFTDPDGTVSQFSLAGPGSATLTFSGGALTRSTSKSGIVTIVGTPTAISVATSGTTGATTINITGHGGNGVVNLAGISTGALRAINAHNTIITGMITATGAIGAITLNSITDAGLSLAGVGKLTLAGALSGAQLTTSGNIGTITASSIADSTIAAAPAGVPASPTVASLIQGVTGFAAADSISSVRVRSFVNSDLIAQTLGKLNLGTIQAANGGSAFGLAAHQITSLLATVGGKKLKLTNVANEAQVTAALATEGIAPQDLLIRIL